MTDYSVTLGTAFALTSNDYYVGTLDDGYFVTRNSSSSDMFLRETTNPTVAVGTVLGGYGSDNHAQNDVGDVYYMRQDSASTQSIHHVTQSGGVLSVTNNGTATNVPFGGFPEPPHLTHDGTQFAVDGGGIAYGVTTATAGSAYQTTYSPHSALVIGAPAADRFMLFCATHDAVELWDGPNDTLLDSNTDTIFLSYFNQGTWMPAGDRKMFVAAQVAAGPPRQFSIGVMDTTGDVLAWTWGPTTVTTDWGAGSGDAVVACWGDTATFLANDDGPPTGSASLYVVDLLTGAVSASSPSSYIGQGAVDGAAGFAGAGTIVIYHDFSPSQWTIWDIVAQAGGPTYLRQRQSPVRSPSRVRPVNLRNRQTPIITK